MPDTVALTIVGDRTAGFPPHDTLDASIEHAADAIGVRVSTAWLSTEALETQDVRSILSHVHALWVAPGSPYRSMNGALGAIQHARENAIPLLGTCGGCQHVVIEFARNVLGVSDAAHAEYDPYASRLVVTPLSCSLVGQDMDVSLVPGSIAATSYAAHATSERYYCNFGINPEYESSLQVGGLHVVGRDADGESRIFELTGHPFFVATLFVPNLRSTAVAPHPLIIAWLRAAEAEACRRRDARVR